MPQTETLPSSIINCFVVITNILNNDIEHDGASGRDDDEEDCKNLPLMMMMMIIIRKKRLLMTKISLRRQTIYVFDYLG